jgi:hypothetical protein
MEAAMDDHYIEDMVQRLKPMLKDPAKAKVILKHYWRDKIALVWETEDVHRAANERETVLTEDEAVKVLQEVLDNHDAQSGVCWQTLTDTIEDKGLGRDMTKLELRRFIHKDILTIQR